MSQMQTPPPLEEVVLEMVALAAGVDRATVNPQTSMLEIGLDSLGMVSIASRCAAIFRVEIEIGDILDLYLAKDLEEFVAAIRQMLARDVSWI